MVSNGDKWVRIFDIPEISKHKKGFTLYKVISMLYPEACPDAITKITVWKRFNDFKKLHRDIKQLHKTLKLKDKLPSLPSAPFFKRFDDVVVQERRQGILDFLEYAAGYPLLFTSNVFVKFFETSHTPSEMLKSSINSIRAELSLPTETEYFPYHSPSSDEERTISDTDSISTLSSFTTSIQPADLLADPLYKSTSSLTRLSRRITSESSTGSSQGSKTTSSDSHDSLNITTMTFDSVQTLDKNIFPTPPTTPNCLTSINPSQYIIDAAQHITLATQFESERKYEGAFAEYKLGIDILLKNVKEDKNLDRKEMVRFKTEKYLLRAEKIYNLHLSSEMKSIQQYTSPADEQRIEYKPFSELYKYKVIKVIASGMLVLHSEFQKLYYVKVIQKTTAFSNDNLILPDHVPYMVKLHNFYNCENALFLVLQYCNGTKLLDYIKQRSASSEFDHSEVFRRNRSTVPSAFNKDSDNDSECSYTDLVHEYACNKTRVDKSCIGKSSIDKTNIESTIIDKSTIDKANVEKANIDKINIGKIKIDNTNIDSTTIDKNNIDKANLEKTNLSKTYIHKNNIVKPSIDKTNIDKTSIESNIEAYDECDMETTVTSSGSFEELKDYIIVSETEEALEYSEPEDLDPEQIDNLETNQLLEKSQKLLSSIDMTLQRNEKRTVKHSKTTKMNVEQTVDVSKKRTSPRKSSDMSICDDFEEFEDYTLLVPVDVVINWAAQLVLALEKLHVLGVVCCDLKMNNLLVDEDGDIVLTYMCNALERTNIFNLKKEFCLAPELYSFGKVSTAADWWSLGIILYELLIGIPFDAMHPEGVSNHTLVKIPKMICAEGRSLLKQLLCFNPKDRLGCGVNGTEDLKSHPFFSSVCWNSLITKYLL